MSFALSLEQLFDVVSGWLGGLVGVILVGAPGDQEGGQVLLCPASTGCDEVEV